MKSQASRHLSSLSEEIARTRAHLRRLRDRLEVEQAALDEQRLRMLIAETPLADRDLHIAADGFLLLSREVQRVESALESLTSEQGMLSRRLTAAGA
jgi:uncharacterized protein (DUF2267 family)